MTVLVGPDGTGGVSIFVDCGAPNSGLPCTAGVTNVCIMGCESLACWFSLPLSDLSNAGVVAQTAETSLYPILTLQAASARRRSSRRTTSHRSGSCRAQRRARSVSPCTRLWTTPSSRPSSATDLRWLFMCRGLSCPPRITRGCASLATLARSTGRWTTGRWTTPRVSLYVTAVWSGVVDNELSCVTSSHDHGARGRSSDSALLSTEANSSITWGSASVPAFHSAERTEKTESAERADGS